MKYFCENFVLIVKVLFVLVHFMECVTARTIQCERCKLSQDCKMFVEMTRAQQTRWIGRYSCDNYKIEDDYSTLFGFAPYAKGDYVCCPENKIENPPETAAENRNKNNNNRRNQGPDKINNQNKRRPNNKPITEDSRIDFPNEQNFNTDSNNRRPNQGNIFEESNQRPWDSNIRQDNPRQQQQNINNEDSNRRNDRQSINQRPNSWDSNMRPNIPINNFNPQITQYPMNNQWQNQNPGFNNNNNGQDPNFNNNNVQNPNFNNNNGQNPNFNNNNNGQNTNFNNNNGQNPNFNNNNGQGLSNGMVNSGRNFQDPSTMFGTPFPRYPSGQPTGQTQFNQNPGFVAGIPQDPNFGMNNPFPHNGIASVSNPYSQENPFQNKGSQPVQPGFGTSNFSLGDQCSARIMTSPPDYKSGCCGRDYAGDDRIIGQDKRKVMPPQNSVTQNFPTANQFMPPIGFSRFASLTERSVDNISVVVENRITGGKATEIEEYPWTVLLVATFTDGYQDSSFNCGGSLISDRYVLTAAHCVSDSKSRLKEVEVTLAEYDKRTFPEDCVNSRSEGRKCIKNLRFKAENVISHPYYDDTRLQNDIALIRLRGRAPYTEFIRPICLPPINIDSSDLKNLPVSVAGWGRNGKLSSNIKQSTTVHLIPQRECKRAYPGLTNRHLCAAGFTGEDTCKGDSGGPLMMLYQGTHFVSGIVSGKRADSPCGTSVPSLYTNVFNYVDWIMENIRN